MERSYLTDDLSFSRIVYGMWRLGDGDDKSAQDVVAKIEACLDQGITTMDQADIYGGYAAEALVGNALRAAPALRDKIELVTKCDIVAPMGRYADKRVKYYDTSRAHLFHSVETSLTEMATDHVDLLLVHRPDPLMDAAETGAALDELVASGKVRAVGVSNFRPWDFSLLQANMTNPLVTNQIEMSLLAHDAFTNGDLASLYERGVKPMAWSPLGGGALFNGQHPELLAALTRMGADHGVDASAVAVAWLMAHPAGILPVLGTNNLARIGTLSDAAKVSLSREDWYELYTLALGHEVA